MKKKSKTINSISKARIMEGYKEILGPEEYSKLPKRDKENLYKRYRVVERATEEYNREKQREKKNDKDL